MDMYKIDELGKKWNKSVNDILRLIVAEKLKWWFRKPITYSSQPTHNQYKLGDPFFAGIFLDNNDTYMEYCYGPGEPCKYYLENFVIFQEEIARVEAEYPGLFKQDRQPELTEEEVSKGGAEEDKANGYAGIAKHLRVSERHTKDLAKKKGFPLIKTINGRVYAYKKQLDEWYIRYKEEKSQRKKDAQRKRNKSFEKTQKESQEKIQF